MPANLPPEIYELIQKAKEAKSIEEKIRIYYEILIKTPKHKGTEKFLKEIKRKISELKKESEKIKKAGKRSYGIKKEAPVMISLIGVENVGKSTFLNEFAGTKLNATEIPFETEKPEVGVVKYKDVNFQFVEIPSFRENISREGELMGIIRNSDFVLIFLTPERDIIEQAKLIKTELENAKIILGKRKEVEIERTIRGGIEIYGIENFEGKREEIVEALKSMGIYNAVVKIKEKINLREFLLSIDPSYSFKPFLVVLNKCDLKRVNGILNISVLKKENIDRMFEEIWKILDIKRIYTKKPGKKPEKKPLVLKGKVTVRDVVEEIHKDFLKSFKYAKIWGPSAKFPGQRVGLDFELSDGDIVEIHT